MQQWWRARWTTCAGIDHEYHFIGDESEAVTRIRFAINLFVMGYTLPDIFTLEEAEPKGGIEWSYPILILSREISAQLKSQRL